MAKIDSFYRFPKGSVANCGLADSAPIVIFFVVDNEARLPDSFDLVAADVGGVAFGFAMGNVVKVESDGE